MSRKLLFIINPISGIGKQKTVEQLLERRIPRTGDAYDIAYTEAPKHAIQISKEATKTYDVVVAVGGDGSVNEISKGLIGSETALGILPSGSGNGLARHLNIPMDLEFALDVIIEGNSKRIDTARINDDIFVGIAGLGFDAHVGWEFSKFGKRGFWSYVQVTSREFMQYKPSEYQISIDGQRFSTEALLITIANSSQYGNDAYIAPEARIDDGFLRICILNKMPLLEIPGFTMRLFNKTINESRHLTTIKGKHIVIEQEGEIAHVDGEPTRLGKHIEIEVIPSSLKVLC